MNYERRPGRHRRRPSELERVFKFTDPSFRKYITIGRTKGVTFDTLNHLSSEMSQHEHPIVRYAGGWAAAEAGMIRTRERAKKPKTSFVALPDRLQSLERAKIIWQDVGEGFKKVEDEISSPKVKAELLGLALRSEQALTYLPSMRLVSMLHSGHEVPGQERDTLLGTTREGLTTFGEKVIDLDGEGKYFFMNRSGVNNEILAGLLLQGFQSPQFVILPASLRQDHNTEEDLRADLTAVSMESKHPKTLIQVSSINESTGHDTKRFRFKIQVPEDLAIPGLRVRSTLRRVLGRERGNVQPEVSSQIDSLSHTLIDKLTAFSSAQ